MSRKKTKTSASFFNAKLTSTISTSLVLFLLGLTTLLILGTRDLSTYVKENIGFSIIISDNVKEAEVQKMAATLSKAPYVKELHHITKEQALEELKEELGEDPEAFLGFNPLLASIEVKLKSDYANNDSIAMIEKKLKKNSDIRDILYRKDLIQAVNDNVRRISIILIALASILMIISFALISNTIRLTVYSKRFIIYTMKLVGAKDSFIRSPFIWNNIGAGIIAAILANGMLALLLYTANKEVDGIISLVDYKVLIFTGVIVFGAGILLTGISAYFAVNRYIKMKYNKLFLV
ncbi:MAG: cell division protein FtsX [Bacteroidales bacterium]